MAKPYPELTVAITELADKIDAVLKKNNYAGPPINMFVAGGMAVNYWCGSRYTEDVDATFSYHKLALPFNELTVHYTSQSGNDSFIYLDPNYNDTFSLMHENYQDDCVEWEGVGNEKRIIKVHVLNPVDLALSKLARFEVQDREDIKTLASENLINIDTLKARFDYAFIGWIGNQDSIRTSFRLACRDIEKIQSRSRHGGLGL